MKYRLIKDLPFAKAGAEVRIFPSPVNSIFVIDASGKSWSIGLHGDLPRLNDKVIRVREVMG